MKIRILPSDDGQQYVRIDGHNGEPLFTSEMLTDHSYAVKLAHSTAEAYMAYGYEVELVDETVTDE